MPPTHLKMSPHYVLAKSKKPFSALCRLWQSPMNTFLNHKIGLFFFVGEK